MLIAKEVISLSTEEYEVLNFGIISVERDSLIEAFLGIPTVLYAVDTFVVKDVFGTELWKDNAAGVVEYVNGFLSAG